MSNLYKDKIALSIKSKIILFSMHCLNYIIDTKYHNKRWEVSSVKTGKIAVSCTKSVASPLSITKEKYLNS